MKSTNAITNAVRDFKNEEGYRYFIFPGSQTSQRTTGRNDYWEYYYEIFFKTPEEKLDVSSAYNMTDLNSEVALIKKNGNTIIAIEVRVEHMSTNCDRWSHKSSLPDLHGHNESLGYVPIEFEGEYHELHDFLWEVS